MRTARKPRTARKLHSVATMRSVRTGVPGAVELVDVELPVPGPRDVLLRVRACGICGADVTFMRWGGMPLGPLGQMVPVPLGHEPAGEIVETGGEVTGLAVGDRVVVNPQDAPSGIIGCGGAQGGMSEYLLIQDAVAGQSVAVIPDSLPFDVAALNEPMAIARHCVDRSGARAGDKVVVFGAGPIGLGATIWLKLRGVAHVTVADPDAGRLRTAPAVGADAVVDSSREDVTARLTRLHGEATDAYGRRCPATDVRIDASGVTAAADTALQSAEQGAGLVTVAAPVKQAAGAPLPRGTTTVIGSHDYPADVFGVTAELARHHERFARLISHRVPFSDVERAFLLALAPGAAEKVVVTFGGRP